MSSMNTDHIEKPAVAKPGWTFLADEKEVDLARIVREMNESGHDAFEVEKLKGSGGGKQLMIRRNTDLARRVVGKLGSMHFRVVNSLGEMVPRWAIGDWFTVSEQGHAAAKEAIAEFRAASKVRVIVRSL